MKTISKLKKELDTIFSIFIRLRESTNEGIVQCFTCSRISHYNQECIVVTFKAADTIQQDGMKLIAKYNALNVICMNKGSSFVLA